MQYTDEGSLIVNVFV